MYAEVNTKTYMKKGRYRLREIIHSHGQYSVHFNSRPKKSVHLNSLSDCCPGRD